MTQMLLFDSVAETTSLNSSSMVVPLVLPTSTTAEAATTGPAAARSREGGLNHMGDLARLVLLRYDLVAQRREKNRRKAR